MRARSAYALLTSFALCACGCSSAPMPPPPPPPAATAAAGPKAPSAPPPPVLRAPTEAEIAAIRSALEPNVKRCFVEWAATRPTASVRAEFDLAYDRFGILSSVLPAPQPGPSGEPPAPDATVACLRSAIAETKIPAPDDVGIAVRLPFEMAPPRSGSGNPKKKKKK